MDEKIIKWKEFLEMTFENALNAQRYDVIGKKIYIRTPPTTICAEFTGTASTAFNTITLSAYNPKAGLLDINHVALAQILSAGKSIDDEKMVIIKKVPPLNLNQSTIRWKSQAGLSSEDKDILNELLKNYINLFK